MKHRNLNHQGLTLAAIDNIIERGLLPDWVPLLLEIEKDPFGDAAKRTLAICEAHEVYGTTSVFRKFVHDKREQALEVSPRQVVLR